MLLRVGRRNEAFADRDAREVVRTEFCRKDGQLDLSPSVYEIEDASLLVQCHAEHAASCGLDPKGGGHFDLAGLATPTEVVADGRFRFTNEAHRELRFRDVTELIRMVEEFLQQVATRKHETTKAELRDYATERWLARDPEWIAALSDSPKLRKWIRKEALGA